MSKKANDPVTIDKINLQSIPRHIAIIMDGNGRWAQRNHLPRTAGHKRGVEAIRDVIRTASDINLEVITFYAFSTENWKRPAEEISFLMSLLIEYLKKELDELHGQQVVIRTIGDLSPFPDQVKAEISKAIEKTNANNGIIMNLALNYGSRNELVRTVKKIVKQTRTQFPADETIDETFIEQFLDTAGLPDPDLLIRTSGEKRISNFLLWQAAYAELYFTDTLWPDFRGEDLLKAIHDFQMRDRRYGGL
jgi:undecaprenyl diphosphate synthase